MAFWGSDGIRLPETEVRVLADALARHANDSQGGDPHKLDGTELENAFLEALPNMPELKKILEGYKGKDPTRCWSFPDSVVNATVRADQMVDVDLKSEINPLLNESFQTNIGIVHAAQRAYERFTAGQSGR